MTVTVSGPAGQQVNALAVTVLTGAASVAAIVSGGKTGTAAGALSPPDLAITPNATGSYVFGAVLSYPYGAAAYTPTAATTFAANGGDIPTTDCNYGAFRSTATTTGGTPVTLGGTAPTGATNACIALAEILAAGTLAVDASSPAGLTGTMSFLTTAAFTPPAGSLLVAAAADVIGGASPMSVSDTMGLTWTQLVLSDTGGDGAAAVWIAALPSFPSPSAQLGVRLELNAGGTWVNVTADLDQGPMVIGRGHPDESTTVSPSTFSATLTNTAARYSPDNVMSDLWPYVVQNMPVRASIPAAQNYLRLEAGNSDCAYVADNATLHVTGSIDVRIGLRLSDWQGCFLAGRLDGVSTGAWFWVLRGDGTMRFGWYDGGGTEHQAVTDVPVPSTGQDFALRVTMDATTGTVTWYTSATIGGTWAQLGDAVTVTGSATTIRAGSDPLRCGWSAGSFNDIGTGSTVQMYGRAYELKVLSGIGGSVVADGIFSAQAAGAATWTDSAGNTWNVAGGAELSGSDYRGHFEASELPQEEPEYNADALNNTSVPVDALVPLVGGGLLRRLSQRAPNVQSAMYRAVLTQPGLVAYWPMEDPFGSSQFASGIGGSPMTWNAGTPALASSTVFACSNPLPAIGGAHIGGQTPAYTGGTQWSVRFTADIPTLPGSSQVLVQVCTVSSVAPYITLIINADGTVTLTAYAGDAVTVVATTGPMSWYGGVQQPQLWSIEATASGANVEYAVSSVAPGASVGGTGNVTTAATGAAGYVGLVLTPPFAGVWTDTVIGHVHVRSVVDSVYSLSSALQAHLAEPAGARFARLCAENSIACRTRGNLADTVLMGIQPSGTLVTLLQACADADQGVWTELRQVLGWGYVTRKALYNQLATVVLSYLLDHLSMWTMPPTRDDQTTVNDVTYQNDSGSSARMYAAAGQPITGGRMSTAAPGSGGVGTYAQTYSVSVASDSQLPDLAGWRLHLGTVDQARLPGIMIDLANTDATAVYNAVLAMDLGDRLVISSPPRRLGFEPVTQICQAITETLGYGTLTIAVAGVPELPYQVWQQSSRVESAGTALHAGVNTTATSWQVDVTGPLWSTSAGDYPLSWVVDGERVTVSAMSGSSSPQTATVTRSANGVVKSHLAGAAISLWPPPVIGL